MHRFSKTDVARSGELHKEGEAMAADNEMVGALQRIEKICCRVRKGSA